MDCDDNIKPTGPAFKSVLGFAIDENVWLDAFHTAWKYATENNHEGLSFMASSSASD